MHYREIVDFRRTLNPEAKISTFVKVLLLDQVERGLAFGNMSIIHGIITYLQLMNDERLLEH